MEDQRVALSLEQQFSLISFRASVEKMSEEQSKEFLVRLYEQQMLKEEVFKRLLKQQWGI